MARKKALSRMTKAELLAEVKAARAQNGQGTQKASSKKVWANYSGFECKSAFGANISSSFIVRHLRGECQCENSRKGCRAVKRYGETAATYASDPTAAWTDYEIA